MSKTADNLIEMARGAAEAEIRYLAFAEAAEREGHRGAAKAFRAVAAAKRVHALSHFRATGAVDTTVENLKQAREEEAYDAKTAYPRMVQDAVADDAIEARHSFEYGMSIGAVIGKVVATALGDPDANAEGSYYVCPVCGDIEFGKAPAKCPYCGVDRSRFLEVA